MACGGWHTLVVAKKKPPKASLDDDDDEKEEKIEGKNKENDGGKERLNRTGTLARSRRRMKEVGDPSQVKISQILSNT